MLLVDKKKLAKQPTDIANTLEGGLILILKYLLSLIGPWTPWTGSFLAARPALLAKEGPTGADSPQPLRSRRSGRLFPIHSAGVTCTSWRMISSSLSCRYTKLYQVLQEQRVVTNMRRERRPVFHLFKVCLFVSNVSLFFMTHLILL